MTDIKENNDSIIYVIRTKPGGIDGKSHDKGGTAKFASFDKHEAEKTYNADPNKPWRELHAEVIDTKQARKDALAKLDAVDHLVLSGVLL